MAVRIIALIKEDKRLVGLRLYDENSGSVGNFVIEEAFRHLEYYGCSNAFIDGKEFIPTECSLERFAVLDNKFSVIKNGGIIVLNCVKKEDETIGYTLVNIKGEKIKVAKEEAIRLALKHGVSNASLVRNGNAPYLRGIKKELPSINVGDVNKKSNEPMKTGNHATKGGVADVFINIYNYVNDSDMYEFGIPINLEKLSSDVLEKLSSKKYAPYVFSINKGANTATLNDSQTEANFAHALKDLLLLLNTLSIEVTNVTFVSGLVDLGGGYFDIETFEAGKLYKVARSKKEDEGITPLVSLKSCSSVLLPAYSLITTYPKCNEKVKERVLKDVECIKNIG